MTLKHYTLLLSLLVVAPTFAQINVGGQPYSTIANWESNDLEALIPRAFDSKAVAQEDIDRDQKGELALYGRRLEMNTDLRSAGQLISLPSGDRVYRLKVTSPGALSTELFFSQFQIPMGGVVYVYDEEKAEVMGGFTAFNEGPDGSFTSSLISGETSIIEYYEPAEHAGSGSILLSHVGHAYRMVPGAKEADPCEVDVNCSPEGDGWSAQRDGVVRISVVSPQGLGWCTGSVVNNTAQDCTPYILTAWHCGDASSAANFNSYKFYFRYQRNNCGSGLAFVNKIMTGCSKVSDSRITGSNDGSDFLLLEANTTIPDDYTPFFAGWNANTSFSTPGKCIHHPAGSEKKISTFTATPASFTWSGSPTGAHWRVFWVGSPNGHGVTEGGSSGSPLYDNQKNVVGTLTGGASFCNSVQPGGQNSPDFYGKMSYHWMSNGSAQAKQLAPWLDPTGSGTLTLDGSHNPCGTYSVFASVDETDNASAFTVAPNPTAGNITISVEDVEVAKVVLLDMAGRVVLEQTISSRKEKIEVDMQQSVQGTYSLQLYDASGVILGSRFVVKM